jgi:hypothetical protein
MDGGASSLDKLVRGAYLEGWLRMFRRAKIRRAEQRGRSAAARLLAVAAIAATGFAQLSTSWHEASVRHVRCAEHGEITHVAMGANRAASSGVHHHAHHQAVVGASEPVAPAGGHDHCDFVFAVQGNAPVPVVRVAVKVAPPPLVAPRPVEPAPLPGRAFVLASAPKTSPPSA